MPKLLGWISYLGFEFETSQLCAWVSRGTCQKKNKSHYVKKKSKTNHMAHAKLDLCLKLTLFFDLKKWKELYRQKRSTSTKKIRAGIGGPWQPRSNFPPLYTLNSPFHWSLYFSHNVNLSNPSSSLRINQSMASFDQAPPGDGKAGEKIFRTKCAQCHTVDKGAGHKQGQISFSFSVTILFGSLSYFLSFSKMRLRSRNRLLVLH